MTAIALSLLAVALLIAIAAETWLVTHLRRQGDDLDYRSAGLHGRVMAQQQMRRRVAAGQSPFEQGFPAGGILNDYLLNDLDGTPHRHSAMRGERLAVVFVQPDCPGSREVIAALRRQPMADRRVVFVTLGDVTANRALFAGGSPGETILLQEDAELARVWRVMRTPALYLVDRKGVTERPLAAGPGQVLGELGIAAPEQAPKATVIKEFFSSFPQAPKVGAIVEDRAFTFISGRTGRLHAARRTLIVALDERCAVCASDLPRIAAALRARAGSNRIVVFALGDADAAARIALVVGPMVGVSMQADTRITRAIGLLNMPSALLIDGDGMAMTEVAIGRAAIEWLCASLAPTANDIGAGT